LVARQISEELLKDFANKPEMSSWFNREESASAVLVKKPNPRNIQHAAKLKELEAEIERYMTLSLRLPVVKY
jgi:kinetochore protein Mis13/DSN1